MAGSSAGYAADDENSGSMVDVGVTDIIGAISRKLCRNAPRALIIFIHEFKQGFDSNDITVFRRVQKRFASLQKKCLF